MTRTSLMSALARPLVAPPAGLEKLRTRLLVLGFWFTLAALETAKEFTAGRLQPTPRPLADAILVNFPWWFAWTFGTLIVVALARRWPLDRERLLPAAARHMVVALLVSAVHLTLVALLVHAAVARGSAMAGADLRVQVRFWLEGYIVLDAFVYWMVLGAYHALLYQHRFVQGALREADARTRAVRFEKAAVTARLQALQMELNPHFLFNSLNAVSALVDEGRNSEATTVISRLAQLLRMTLGHGSQREIELERELEYAELYLDMERVRFGPRLRCEVVADAAVRSALVPPMILQPLVENAVRHGAARIPGMAHVRVSAVRDGGVLVLAVEDDGPGVDGAVPPGRGVANVRERLDTLYGSGARLDIAGGASGRGTRAEVRLPLHTSDAASTGLAVAT
ncbi:MAG TPA: histidine kinase [Longimicrobiales bacterium]|nr:histidine kinase [Longimicrobiales bacterium]